MEIELLKEPNPFPLLKVTDVAKMINVHPNTLRKWSDQGYIRSYRFGHRGDRRFAREDVARLLESG